MSGSFQDVAVVGQRNCWAAVRERSILVDLVLRLVHLDALGTQEELHHLLLLQQLLHMVLEHMLIS